MSGASGGHYGVEERGRADGMSSTLVIRDVIASDFGEYNCSVRNSHGEDAFTITLQRKSELMSTERKSIRVRSRNLSPNLLRTCIIHEFLSMGIHLAR